MPKNLGTLSDVAGKKFKKGANALNKGETRRQKTWEKCVEEAKTLITNYKNIRFQVVDLAQKCCTIHHGGTAKTERYTLKRFAEEIGIPMKTMNEWHRIKVNIYDNLPKKKQETMSFNDMRCVDVNLKGINRLKPEFKTNLRRAVRELDAKHPVTVKMEKYLKHLKTIHFNVVNERMIKDCDGEVLGEICHLSREIINVLGKHDKKKKYANV